MTEYVAELSCNHGGSIHRALKLVDAAANAGATAIKLQVWHPDRMVLDPNWALPDGPWAPHTLHELYRQAHTPWHWVPILFTSARARHLDAFASVFDTAALAYLEECECPRYKIASFELVDLPLIMAVARTGKPMIISTGMGTLDEIADAVEQAKMGGCRDLTLLRCTSAYPAPESETGIPALRTLQERFGCKVGLSDHTTGYGAAAAAVACGADMIERHLILDRRQGGPDAQFSAEPAEFSSMVKTCQEVKQAMGVPIFGPRPSEKPQLRLRRSLHFARALPAHHKIISDDLTTARPALGMPPADLPSVIGQDTARAVRRGEPVTADCICNS